MLGWKSIQISTASSDNKVGARSKMPKRRTPKKKTTERDPQRVRVSYTGRAGHLAVMSEFILRGYNVATPEIDIGDDLYVLNEITGEFWRVQVKSSTVARVNPSGSRLYAFRTRSEVIQKRRKPDSIFVFALRDESRWRYFIISRADLKKLLIKGKGALPGGHVMIYFVINIDGSVVCSSLNLGRFENDWSSWPPLRRTKSEVKRK